MTDKDASPGLSRVASTPDVAEVALAAPVGAADGLLDYRVPPDLATLVLPGVRLVVPLLGRAVEGYCLRVKSGSEVPPERLRDILAVMDSGPIYPPAALELARWTARRYLCQPGEVLRAAVPAARRYRGQIVAKLAVSKEAAKAAAGLQARAPVQAAILAELSRAPAEVTFLRRRFGAQTPRSLAALERRGLAVLIQRGAGLPRRPSDGSCSGRRSRAPDRTVGLVPVSTAGGPTATAIRLSPEQEAALATLRASLAGRTGVFVLHGVTGSGKTEVYLRAAAEALALGRQILLLVPEIALVHQTLERVRSHLGPTRVAVAHSYLGGRERLDYWERVVGGEADVVVGARSAVFAPLDHVGLIVLDEEHEDAYKQEEGAPRYHAREVAVWRAGREGATLVLASATPSLETYHRALGGEYTLLSLPERVTGHPLPPVEVVDMRAELAAGNRSLFSRRLRAALAETLRGRRQTILFLNRRGHSTFVLCRDCGWVARCPNCDVSLTYHDPESDLTCHWCGHRAPAPARCPGCGGHRVRYFGAGTQRVEDEVRALHPDARVGRLDTDVVRRAGDAGRLLALFEAGQIDVLVGTQMVAKGLDVPDVALVGAVAADSALHLPDFRAAEKTFRLLTQAAGRAGRGSHPGRVVIQTYSPDHPAVAAAARHDYLGFARGESEVRRALGYPPWSNLVRAEFSDADAGRAERAAGRLARALGARGFDNQALGPIDPDRPRVGGPAPAPLGRLKGRYRWQVLVFCPGLAEGLEAVRSAVREVTGHEARGGRRRRQGEVAVAVDVDPVSVL